MRTDFTLWVLNVDGIRSRVFQIQLRIFPSISTSLLSSSVHERESLYHMHMKVCHLR